MPGKRGPYRKADPLERLLARVDVGLCWEFTGSNIRGYGQFHVNGRTTLTHRWLYQQLVGPIPPDHDLDHLCLNPPCCNPDHLEVVTHGENMSRIEERRYS